MKKIALLFLLTFVIAIANAQNYQISFAGSGASMTVDSVNVENLTQCTDTIIRGSDILHLVATIGINEINTDANNAICIYPNPMTNKCSIDFEAIAQGKTIIGLYDITGKMIIQVQELLTKGNQKYSLSGITSGIYSLKIESDKYSYTTKLVSTNATIGTAELKHIATMPSTDKQSMISNTGQKKILNGDKSLIDMQYTTGDILKLTGKSGVYRTIFLLIPTQSETVTFNYIPCTDADSNHYSVVQIGTQLWMAENLKTTKYNNGTPITFVTDSANWSNLTSEAYCWYNNDSANAETYGALYNWYAVDTTSNGNRNICPAGWHISTDDEWTTLTTYLGGVSVAGGKLKECCSSYWNSPNTGATNVTGFTALPGGWRFNSWVFIESNGIWWSSTSYSIDRAHCRIMQFDNNSVYRDQFLKRTGLTVRCIKD